MRYSAFRPGLQITFTLAIVLLLAMTIVPRGAEDSEWRAFSGDNKGWRYSTLDQINKDNAKNLKIAWRRSAMPEEIRKGRSTIALPTDYQTVPIMAGSLVYMKASDGSVVALNPATGASVWSHVPPELIPTEKVEADAAPRTVLSGAPTQRGLAYWTDGKESRIITTFGPRLAALDAKTGAVVSAFGTKGSIDLTKDFRRSAISFRWRGVPVVANDTIIIAGLGTRADGTTVPGDIRAYDVRTGKLKWRFNVIPELSEAGADTWLNDSFEDAGAGGVWGSMAVDEELGYLYVPTEEPTAGGGGDFYGGQRPGNNLFSQSLVCLDIKTGTRVWHFQAVHHSLWDWDFTSSPNIIDITVDGRKIKAVSQVSKQGFVYTFDRVTGEPVWPIEERPVPKGNVPGEWYAPTQPFPTKPAPFDRQGASEDDLIDFTPELRADALKVLNQYFYFDGPYAPPTTAENGKQGTIQRPGPMGGANWPGAGFDPDTNILYVPSSHTPTITLMVKAGEDSPNASPNAQNNAGQPRGPVSEWTNKKGAAITGPWVHGTEGLPLFKPPWGRLVAIDMNKGEILWTVANGEGPRNHPAIKHLNLPKLGQSGHVGPLVTKTLVFIGEGTARTMRPGYHGGKMFRAYDKTTGDTVWEMELPAAASGPPITYTYNGKQYIVMATSLKDVAGEIIALALP